MKERGQRKFDCKSDSEIVARKKLRFEKCQSDDEVWVKHENQMELSYCDCKRIV